MNEIISYIVDYGLLFLKLLALFFIIKFIINSTVKNFHSNWNTLIDNFNFSTEEFYTLLSKELQSNGIDDIQINHVFLKQGNTFSSHRTYLRMEWKDYQYDICGAPFGNGFFISWWLLYKNTIIEIIISKIPFIGEWIVRKLYTVTYYKVDTASMFMSYAQQSVLKVIDDITKEKGVRTLTESERKPILKDIFKR